MRQLSKGRLILHAAVTFLAFISSLPVLGDVLGGAAWGGFNLVVCLYLFFSIVGSFGLFFGTFTTFARKPVYRWITGFSALFIGLLSVIFLCGFLFGRDKSLPLNDPLFIGGLQIPIIGLYGFAIVLCITVIWSCVARLSKNEAA
jgi:hypothetical protein